MNYQNTSRKICAKQIQQINILLTEAKLREQKDALVHSYSSGRSTSMRDLYYEEADELITYLRQMHYDAADRMRKKIIGILRDMGYTKVKSGKHVADMSAVYKLIESKGYLKKPFNAYTSTELPKLVSQIESISRKEMKKVSKRI